jgi:5-methylcytosine-specific restriction endonuclease McrA
VSDPGVEGLNPVADREVHDRASLHAALNAFAADLNASDLQGSASASYVGSAERFVRWLERDYRPRNSAADTTPLKAAPWNTAELRAELERYRTVLADARMRPLAIQTYVHAAGVFVRWLHGDYRPRAAREPVRAAVSRIGGLPFGRYDHGGARLLGIPAARDGTARHGYGPPVFAACGYQCAYCGFDMANPYENWLNLSVDHVVPQHLTKAAWPQEWLLDLLNLVTCCRACNEFLNGYRVTETIPPSSLSEFVAIRDHVFVEKLQHAQKRHAVERERYIAARPTGPTEAQDELIK